MILSFTKEMADIFSLDLKASKSQVFSVTPVLDDWIMSCLWNRDEHLGAALIHKHSLFSIVIVSEVKELFYCLDLFYEQILDILIEAKLNEEKYFKFFDNLFQNINAIKNDDKTLASQVKFIYDKLDECEERARINETKLHSIEITKELNNFPRPKLDEETPIHVFLNLLKLHYNDPTLEIEESHTLKTLH